jgi:two-component system chemotaxis sensor kinase CheA
MDDEVDEVVAEFLMESHENLDQLDNDFIALEEHPHDRALLASVFRTIHTIKGTCGFLGFSQLESLTHAGEHLLSQLRTGALTLDAARTSALLKMVDEVRSMMRLIEQTGSDGDTPATALIDELERLSHPGAEADQPADPVADPTPAPAEPDVATSDDATTTAEAADIDPSDTPVAPDADSEVAEASGASASTVDTVEQTMNDTDTSEAAPAPAPKARKPRTRKAAAKPTATKAAKPAATPDAPAAKLGELLVESGDAAQSDVDLALIEQEFGDSRKVGEIMVAHGSTAAGAVAEALERQDAGDGENKGSIADSTIRVEVTRLDRLMNLVGELVLSRNNILQAVAGNTDRNLVTAAQRLDLITSDLQENLMKTRMQPVGSAWSKMPRIVREVANACGKQVRLEMIGEETELDKTVIDAIRDPLTHLVRNAIDHGIERPDLRSTVGKPSDGRLLLKASHESGQVVIEITDDGAGIDAERVKAKAVANGLITVDQAGQMAERDAINLIFLPGFSTAEKVTSVSGRGVGMDVVKTKIEQIGGTVDVNTRLGHGSTFTVKIPLTLAIVPALLVRCAGERFAIPEINVVELVQLKHDAEGSGIEMLHNAPVYRLRGQLLPLVDLRSVLELSNEGNERITLAVLQADDRQFGVLVDEVVDTQEIVVKPLSRLLSSVSMYAGATIMGDGRVALILDVFRLGQHAHVLTESAGGTRFDRDDERTVASEWSTMLLVAAGDRRAALRLDQITRLEQISIDAIEWRGHQQVVQYRGDIMPLVQLGDVMSAGGGMTESDELTVVVCGHGPHVGLVVDTIIDICTTEAASLVDAEQNTVVLQEKVTEVVDVARVLAAGGVYDQFDHHSGEYADEYEGSLV